VRGFANLLLGVHRKQHVVVEAVAAIIPAMLQIEVHLRALGQPQIQVLVLEVNRSVFNDLVLRQELHIRHWLDELRFDTHDLKLVGRNPGPALQSHRIVVVADGEALNAAWAILSLAEVNQPSGLPVPFS